MKVIIAGGRDFNDYNLLEKSCDFYLQNVKEVEIVSGKQRTRNYVGSEDYGADFLGEKYATNRGYKVKEFPADWNLGKSAGPVRNNEMAEYADYLIAFWNGKSKGTKNMIDLAEKKGLNVRIVKYN